MANELYQVIRMPDRYGKSADKTVIAKDADATKAIAAIMLDAGLISKINNVMLALTMPADVPAEKDERSSLEKIGDAINIFD